MTENKNNQGMSDRTRYLLAAVLVCSALLLGVVAPVKATDLSDVNGVGCNYVKSDLFHKYPCVHLFDPVGGSASPTMIWDTTTIAYPNDVAITPDGRWTIVSSPGGVHVFDRNKNVKTSYGGSGAAQIAVSPDGTTAVIGSDNSNTLTVLTFSGDVVTKSQKAFTDTNSHVSAVGITPDSQYLLVGAFDGYVYILDLRTPNEIPNKIHRDNFRPGWMAMDPSGKSAVITSYESDDVVILTTDLENGAFSFRGSVAVTDPGEPDITADGRYAFVPSTTNSGTVSVIDLLASTPAVVGNPIAVGSSPQGVAIVDDDNVALVTNRMSSTISVIDIASFSLAKTIGPSPATTSINRFAVWRPNQFPTADAGPDQEVSPGTDVALDGGGSSDPDRDHYLTYAWTITAPDGTTATLNGIDPTFPASQMGTYDVELTVTDPLGLPSTDEMSVLVKPSNTPPILDAIGAKSVDEGQLLTFSITASDKETPSADLTFSAEPLPRWATLVGPTFSANPTDGDAGECKVKFTVTDGSGESAEETVTITVNDVVFDKTAPELSVFTADPNPVAFNTPVVLSATIDDSGTGSSIVESASCSIDGGAPLSMTAQDGAFDESAETATCTLTGLTTGVHRVNIQAADAEGNIATISEPLLIIVYDPSAGFVTGGGWINSPVDTTSPYQAVTDKATFGFVAKYQKGMTAPKGETEFTFKTGGMAFRSESYNWLVVTQTPEGLPMAELQGTGTLNGVGGYVMTLTALDNGRADTLRFQIADSTKKIVYDTGDAMIPLEGGSIVIHS